MVGLEFTKLLKRKINYLIFMMFFLVVSTLLYKMEYVKEFLEISDREYFKNYLRILLVIVMFVLSLNMVYVYRFDYKNRLDKLIKYSKVSNFKNLFSKLCSVYIFGVLQYLIYLAMAIVYLYRRNNLFFNEIIKEKNFYYAIILTLSMSLCISCLTLFLSIIFNNTNLTITSVLLILLGHTYLLEYLASRWGIFEKMNIISKGFTNISLDLHNYLYSVVFIGISILIFMVANVFKKLVK